MQLKFQLRNPNRSNYFYLANEDITSNTIRYLKCLSTAFDWFGSLGAPEGIVYLFNPQHFDRCYDAMYHQYEVRRIKNWRQFVFTIIDALHNSDFLFPVCTKARLRMYHAALIMADANALRTDILGINLNLERLASYRIDELKFWLQCRGDSLKRLPTKATCIQR